MSPTAASRSQTQGQQPGREKGILKYRRLFIVLAHIGCFFVALLLAFTLAFAYGNFSSRRRLVFQLPVLFAVALPVKLIVFAHLRQFHGWWRYVGLADLFMIVKASFVCLLVLLGVWYGYIYWGEKAVSLAVIEQLEMRLETYQNLGDEAVAQEEQRHYARKYANLKGLYDFIRVARIPEVNRQKQKEGIDSETLSRLNAESVELSDVKRSIEGVLVLDLFATVLVLSGLRMLIRLYHEEFFAEQRGAVRRYLIVGAGNAGEALMRELSRKKDVQYNVVGFVDDDPGKIDVRIHGVPVLGNIDHIPEICKKQNIDEIAIAIPSASRKQLRHVVQICQGTKLRFSMVPSLTDIATGKLQVSQMRSVDINDLLGRDVVQLDMAQIEMFLKDKVILVTGAGGSIGSEMCRQVGAFGPRQLLLVEQAENPLFFIERELQQKFPNVSLEAIIGDIAEKERVNQIFAKYHPQVVIHAAAHKHVPLMEGNPGEAIKNNIVGTRNVADASDAFGADHFVMISTDKAVNPTSVMGSSKRIAEMYIQDLNTTSRTHFVTVRFGNVLGSNGSVIPIFNQQIADGGPVTVTHPDMRRYFMTIPEASQLVLQAAAMGQGGEIFVLDMGEPVKIVDLARELITLSGFRPGEDIEIEFTGLRPGEKLFEELSIQGEDMLPTNHPKIAVWKNIPKDRQSLYAGIEKLVSVAATQDRSKIVAAIKELIPNFIGKD
ncbi:MAG: polysaccharide biosynthesis protein [Planctomycetales bacterium]|nr:polysaccharide biosynthesis protein [Planctomycetales bacterium]